MSIWRIVLVLAAAGVGLIFMGKVEFEQAAALEVPPQLVTCRQLEGTEQLDSPSIILSDFNSPNTTVYQESSHGTAWEWVWIPAFPLHAEELPRPEDYRVVLKVYASNEDELEELLMKDTVEGQVWNHAQALDPEARALLQEAYPGIQLDKCHLVEIGRRRPSRDTAVTFWTIAAGCLVGAVGCSFFGFRRMQVSSGAGAFETQQLDALRDAERFRSDKF
jgi:hypothetical protein